jgi:hypothetical protein
MLEAVCRVVETSSVVMGIHVRGGRGGGSLAWCIGIWHGSVGKNFEWKISAFWSGASTRFPKAFLRGGKSLVQQP